MKKLIVLAVTVSALMAMATTVLAGPGANSPWEMQYEYDVAGNIIGPAYCPHPSNPTDFQSGIWYYNTHSGKTHCFKA